MMRLFLISGVAVALFALSYWMYAQGNKNAVAACEAQKKEALDDRLDTRQKQDRVIRPDDLEYIERLRGYSA